MFSSALKITAVPAHTFSLAGLCSQVALYPVFALYPVLCITITVSVATDSSSKWVTCILHCNFEVTIKAPL